MKNLGRPVVQSEQSESGVLHCPFESTQDVKALLLPGEKFRESLDVVVKWVMKKADSTAAPLGPTLAPAFFITLLKES